MRSAPPTATLSTPVIAIGRTVSSVTPPDASSASFPFSPPDRASGEYAGSGRVSIVGPVMLSGSVGGGGGSSSEGALQRYMFGKAESAECIVPGIERALVFGDCAISPLASKVRPKSIYDQTRVHEGLRSP